MFAFLTLTTPAMLAGLGLLSLPILAHLLRRRSQRTIVFPSIALLVETVSRHARHHRLQRWTLLILRLLAVACIVLAFTRPVWNDAAAHSAVADGQSIAVVLVVDISASSAQVTGGVTELHRLTAQAAHVLDELRVGTDLAGIVVAGANPRPVFPRLSANLPGLRSELGRLTSETRRADLAGALVAAGELLEPHAGERRIVICSDLQRTNWADLLADPGPQELVPAGVTVSLLPRGGKAPGNVALSRPACFPRSPLPGESAELSVSVANFSDVTREVRVVCRRTEIDQAADKRPDQETTLRLSAGEQRSVAFQVSRGIEERELVEFRCHPPDDFEIDNVASLVVQADRQTPVLLVTDDDPAEPGTAGYYLMRALSPETDGAGRFRTIATRSRELTAAALRGAAVVVVGYLGRISDATALLLAQHVEQGGNLLFFCGEGPVDQNLAALDRALAPGRLLPWQPGTRRTSLSGREPRTIDSGRWQSRWLRQFDEQSQLALEQVRFERTWTAGAVAATTEVLLSFDDQSPALGARPVGTGMFLLASFSPDSTTSDFARYGSFVALTQMLTLAAVAGGSAPHELLAGDAWVVDREFSPQDAARLVAFDPAGQPVPLTTRVSDGKATATVPRTSVPGVYRILLEDRVVAVTAVQLDPRESNLATVDASILEQALQRAGGVVIAAARSGSGLAPLHGRPLWGLCFSIALFAIAAELLLLGLWRR